MLYFIAIPVSDILLYSAIVIASIIGPYFLYRWIFNIPQRTKYAKAQMELLAKMAEKQGVSKEEIDEIVKKVG